MKLVKVGEFRILSSTAVISDPCYSIGMWCQGSLENVKRGIWSAFVLIGNDDCIAKLQAFHGRKVNAYEAAIWGKVPYEIGVDSGQCGIFAANHYRDDASVKFVARLGTEVICADEPWYSICCDRTLNTDHRAGIIPYGCVSASGYGDGSYRCYIQKNDNSQIVGIKIEFIPD